MFPPESFKFLYLPDCSNFLNLSISFTGIISSGSFDFSAAKFGFVAVDRKILFNLNQKVCVGKANFVAGRGGIWENNCQRCVVAYELRRRGIDVTALPCLTDPKAEEEMRPLRETAGASLEPLSVLRRTAAKAIY